MRAEPNVWFTTIHQVATWAAETSQNTDIRVPLPGERT